MLIGRGSSADGPQGDLDYNNVRLLLKFEGDNGDTTTTDSSQYNHTISRLFGANALNVEISTAQAKYGSSSTFLDNSSSSTGGGWETDTGQSALDADDALDWTIEFWAYIVSPKDAGGAVQYVWDSMSGANTGVQIKWQLGNWGAQVLGSFFNASSSVVENTWTHIALVRDGTDSHFYIDGVWKETEVIGSGNVNFNNAYHINIGSRAGTGTDGIVGSGAYIDELRWTHGVCRYPGATNFTVPTTMPTTLWKSPQ